MGHAVGLLEGHPPFAPLRLRSLDVIGQEGVALPPALTAALADARLHPEMDQLQLRHADFRAPGALDAVADAAVARTCLLFLFFHHCALSPAAAPALARVLRHSAQLALLLLHGGAATILDAAGAATIGDALRASDTLEYLALLELPQLSAHAVTSFVGALVGHRSLRVLDLRGTIVEDPAAAGVALAALLAADAPVLEDLRVPGCGLGGAGLGPLLDALQHNSCLRKLDIRGNGVPAGFMRGRLLPAVRANTSLRVLRIYDENEVINDEDEGSTVDEAQRIIAAH